MSKHEVTKSSEKKSSIEDRIRDRAYELYLERMSVERDMPEGNGEEDWLRAEKEIAAPTQSPGKAA
jgi:hypothetical protein